MVFVRSALLAILTAPLPVDATVKFPAMVASLELPKLTAAVWAGQFQVKFPKVWPRPMLVSTLVPVVQPVIAQVELLLQVAAGNTPEFCAC